MALAYEIINGISVNEETQKFYFDQSEIHIKNINSTLSDLYNDSDSELYPDKSLFIGELYFNSITGPVELSSKRIYTDSDGHLVYVFDNPAHFTQDSADLYNICFNYIKIQLKYNGNKVGTTARLTKTDIMCTKRSVLSESFTQGITDITDDLNSHSIGTIVLSIDETKGLNYNQINWSYIWNDLRNLFNFINSNTGYTVTSLNDRIIVPYQPLAINESIDSNKNLSIQIKLKENLPNGTYRVKINPLMENATEECVNADDSIISPVEFVFTVNLDKAYFPKVKAEIDPTHYPVYDHWNRILLTSPDDVNNCNIYWHGGQYRGDYYAFNNDIMFLHIPILPEITEEMLACDDGEDIFRLIMPSNDSIPYKFISYTRTSSERIYVIRCPRYVYKPGMFIYHIMLEFRGNSIFMPEQNFLYILTILHNDRRGPVPSKISLSYHGDDSVQYPQYDPAGHIYELAYPGSDEAHFYRPKLMLTKEDGTEIDIRVEMNKYEDNTPIKVFFPEPTGACASETYRLTCTLEDVEDGPVYEVYPMKVMYPGGQHDYQGKITRRPTKTTLGHLDTVCTHCGDTQGDGVDFIKLKRRNPKS